MKRRITKPVVRRTSRQTTTQPRSGRSVLVAVALFAVLLGFGLLYVSQVNSVATSGLVMRDLEKQIRNLQRANQDLELRAAALRSLSTVEYTSKQLNLVVRAKADYLPTIPATVARGE